MSTTYLFRIDGARDNDEFFTALRPAVAQVYAGVDLRIGALGWIPDFVRIVLNESQNECLLTLIELEATRSAAMISCRKYLPENSINILHALSDYLDRVIRQCQSTADPRKDEFAHLKTVLSKAERVTVTTAGAVRSSTGFEEELPLMDQPKSVMQPRPVQHNHVEEDRYFSGILRLSALEAKTLARSVLILDAVVRHLDHSAATFKSWRAQERSQPLKYLLKKNRESYSSLRSFVFGSANRGGILDFEMVLSELVEIWSADRETQFDREQVRSLINRYFPIALAIKGHDQMPAIFEAARKHIADEAV